MDMTPTECLTIVNWATAYLRYAKDNYVVKTFKEKLGAFRGLRKCLGNIPVQEISTAKAFQYLSGEYNTRSGNAANKDRKNLSAAWTYGNRFIEGFPKVDVNPFAEVIRFKEERSPRYIPSEDDFWQIYETAEGQDQVMLSVFIYLAARRKEVFNLKWSDIDFEKNQIRLWTNKRQGGTHESDWLPMLPELTEKLKGWKGECPIKDTPYVFVCLEATAFTEQYYGKPFQVRQHFMKKLCAKAGVEPFGFHAIRHLTASMLYHRGVQVSVIQALLRHKSPTTTNRYLQSLGVGFVREGLEKVFGNGYSTESIAV